MPRSRAQRYRPPSWASSPGNISSVATGTISRNATCLTPARSPTHARILPPTSNPAIFPALLTGSSSCRSCGYLLVGHARHCLRCGGLARGDPADLRLAHHLQPQPRKVSHHCLFRLPRRRLHHGGGRTDLRVHAGAEQCDGFRLRPDHGDAGLFRARCFPLRTISRPRAQHHAADLRQSASS